jgi:hypothetical protein
MVQPILQDETADYGRLQQSYVYQMKVPLKLSGLFSEPMRFRTTIEESDNENANLKLQHGSVGRLVSGVFPCLVLELHAIGTGNFVFVVNIHSEGGHHFFEVSGEILDEKTYRKHSRSKMQLKQKGLKKSNVHKLRPIYDKPSSMLAEKAIKNNQNMLNSSFDESKIEIYDNESLLSKPQNHNKSIDNLSNPIASKTIMTHSSSLYDKHVTRKSSYSSIDAVINLLSSEEIDEISMIPSSLSGTYFDRKTQKLCLSKSMRSNYDIDPSCSLDILIEKYRQKEEVLFEKMERKGHVSSRVMEHLSAKTR